MTPGVSSNGINLPGYNQIDNSAATFISQNQVKSCRATPRYAALRRAALRRVAHAATDTRA